MAYIDLPLDELQAYLPPRTEPADFDAFWQATLEQARAYSLAAVFAPVDYGLSQLETFDVTFAGFDGQPIKGWLLLPKARKGPLPCVVEYLGYGGGRSFPPAWTVFASAGWAHLVMDTRGQGSSWASGDTPDLGSDGSPEYPGVMTRGILAPRSYYYRRVFTDAVRAVEAARSHPAVDSSRIAVSGGSQGGGITLAVSGLLPDVQAALPDVPFLCHYHRATTLVDSFPYGEIRSYLKAHRNQVETVFQTLSYFDGLNFATRARATALFSVGLMDDICPPSTVYAAYNYYAGPKRICVYEFNQHDGGGIHQTNEKLAFLHKLWGE